MAFTKDKFSDVLHSVVRANVKADLAVSLAEQEHKNLIITVGGLKVTLTQERQKQL